MTHPDFRLPKAIGLLGLLLASCATPAPAPPQHGTSTGLADNVTLPSDPDQGAMDFGDDWASIEARLNGSGRNGSTPSSTDTTTPRTGVAPAPGVAIAIATFTGDQHRLMAEAALAALAPRVPALARDMGVHTDERGSMLMYGHYPAFDDPILKADLRRLKATRVDGRRVFGLVLPAEVRAPLVLEDLHPLDLHRVRLQWPDIRVLYTLEVAWLGPEATGVDGYAKALQLATQLRSAGHEAYVLHQPHRGRSSVCVGIFDHTARDASSELESANVMQVRRRFPAVRIDGWLAEVPVDPQRPDGRTRPVAPPLIDIPRH